MAEPRCRLCLTGELSPALALEHAPANISALLRPEQFDRDKPVTLRVLQCDACGFVQLTQFLADDYYDDYIMTVSHSPRMQRFQREQAAMFIERFGLHGKRIIEVGCGDGNYLDVLRDAGAEVTGLEPSRRFRALAEQRGATILDGYVRADSQLHGAPYDGFVTRQVLEHVPDVNDFLRGLHNLLGPGGAGLIEVPSLEKALADGRFYDFFPDHLNYFTRTTLTHALARNGFDVVETHHAMDGEYNVALVRKGERTDFAALRKAAEQTVSHLRDFIAKHRENGRRIAVWGAGGKGLTAMAVANVEGVAYVVDSDPNKQGLHTPVCHLPVVAPEHLQRDPVDVVIVTSLAYRDEVIAQLRQTLQFTGMIEVLGENA